MKTQILVALAMIASFNSAVAGSGSVSRPRQIGEAFIKKANDAKSVIGQKLQAIREEKETGFCSQNCVIPAQLNVLNLSMIVTNSEVYTGKIISEDEVDPGYENWTVDVYVGAKEVVYGGRITSKSAVGFTCTLEAAAYESPAATIKCQPK